MAITPKFLKRISRLYNAPVLDALNRPVDWQPASHVLEDWGWLKVIADGNDVTFFRDVPVIVESMTFDEPFDDAICQLTFPQITPFEIIPGWIGDRHPVEIIRVLPDTTEETMFEGYMSLQGDTCDADAFGAHVEVHGALFIVDDYMAKPALTALPVRDIGDAIAACFTEDACPGVMSDPVHAGHVITEMAAVATGIMTKKWGGWNPMLTGFVQELLADATRDDASQWTVHKQTGRIPVLELKDKDTVQWNVYCGAPGVAHDLSIDWSQAANVYYGEGVNAGHCRWRNAKYPNLRPDAAPVFDGTDINPGDATDQWVLCENELIARGFPMAPDGFYDPAGEPDYVRFFQAMAGVAVTGVINAQTWAALFEPGTGGGDLTGAYFMPVAWTTPFVMPFYLGANDTKIDNPDYDPSYARRERYINYGEPMEIGDAAKSGDWFLRRTYPPDYIGTITLKADPDEGHKFDIRAGHNIRLRGHRGVDRVLHIASVDMNIQEETVELTVDEAGRDALTIAQIIERNKDNSSPTWKQDKKYRNSKQTEDGTVTWDCECGSGIIPYHAVTGGLWNVLRIPAAAGGTIAKSQFFVDTPSRCSIGIFDREKTAADMLAVGADGPLVQYDLPDATAGNFWDLFDDSDDLHSGLIIAWGDWDNAAGYYPHQETDGGDPSGVTVDSATWYFESTVAPWLWVAIWVEDPDAGTNYFHGELLPGVFNG